MRPCKPSSRVITGLARGLFLYCVRLSFEKYLMFVLHVVDNFIIVFFKIVFYMMFWSVLFCVIK